MLVAGRSLAGVALCSTSRSLIHVGGTRLEYLGGSSGVVGCCWASFGIDATKAVGLCQCSIESIRYFLGSESGEKNVYSLYMVCCRKRLSTEHFQASRTIIMETENNPNIAINGTDWLLPFHCSGSGLYPLRNSVDINDHCFKETLSKHTYASPHTS